jgi:hypothetical protein
MQPILVSAGDVLLMRPLLAHSSGNSHEGTQRHRRIVHLEFASAAPLPDEYEWHDFHPVSLDLDLQSVHTWTTDSSSNDPRTPSSD